MNQFIMLDEAPFLAVFRSKTVRTLTRIVVFKRNVTTLKISSDLQATILICKHFRKNVYPLSRRYFCQITTGDTHK